MKILRNFILTVALIFGFAVTSRAQEYNIASCGKSFTVEHVVIKDNKLTFDHYMTDPKTVVKDVDPLVFDYKAEAKDKDGNIRFKAIKAIEGHTVEIGGIIRNDRFVGLLQIDGNLVWVFYGYAGSVEDMPKNVEEGMALCGMIHEMDVDSIPDVLVRFLTQNSATEN